jgi:hypothetical protein
MVPVPVPTFEKVMVPLPGPTFEKLRLRFRFHNTACRMSPHGPAVASQGLSLIVGLVFLVVLLMASLAS